MDVTNIQDSIITENSPVSIEKDRAIRLFRFLIELTQLRSKTVRHIDSYDKILWFQEIPRERECDCIAWYYENNEKEPEFWVSVQQPKFIPAPKTPSALEDWILPGEIANSSKEKPAIKDKIIQEKEVVNQETGEKEYETIVLYFQDYNDLQQLWDSYIREKWQPWAQEDQRLIKIQEIYKNLYTIYQKQQKLSETYEVVIGLGLLTWLTPSNQTVKRHILSAQTSLDFDSKRGIITLSLAGEGAKPSLEVDMLEAGELPGIKEINEINTLVDEIKDSVWAREIIEPILKSFVHSISDQGNYQRTLIPQSECSNIPLIHLAPAIILRKREERSLIYLFKKIVEQLSEEHRKLPNGIVRLVSIQEQKQVEESSYSGGESSSSFDIDDSEIYFPLLANKDQQEIVNKINYKNGVLVQGPPGTGKSHTIANLICHLLAKGQRVLVTSHTKRALEVLQSKIPENISALCVSLLGNDHGALKKLERSVEGINHYYCNWNKKENEHKIALCRQKLDDARRNEAEILNKLRALREKESYKYNELFKNYKGTLKEIAEQLKQDEERFSWIGEVEFKEDYKVPPLLNDDSLRLLRLLREYNPEKITELLNITIPASEIPDTEQFMEFVAAEKEAFDKFNENIKYKSYESYQILQGVEDELRTSLLEYANNLFVAIEKIINHRQAYTDKLVEDMLADHDRKWKLLFNVTREKIAKIEQKAHEFSDYTVSGLDIRDLLIVKNDAEDLLSYLEVGRPINFITKSFNHTLKNTKYLYEEVRVNGTLCSNPLILKKLIEWIEVNQEFKNLKKNWEGVTPIPEGTFIQQVEEYKDILEPLEESLKLYELVKSVKDFISKIPGLKHPAWHKPDEINELVNVLKAIDLEKITEENKDKFENIERQLLLEINHSNSYVEELINAIKTRNIEHYKKCMDTFTNIQKQQNEIKVLEDLKYKLKSKLPYLYEKILAELNDSKWDKRLRLFEQAWGFALADFWLKKTNNPKEQERLNTSLKVRQRVIDNAMSALVEYMAWKHCLEKMTETQRHHLIAWSQEVKLIGKGTGKNAGQHRENARKNMNYCRDVIPAWIMPIYRVAETIHPGEEMFDVCIIDEASQSGPEALFLYYLAKKIIVVGDDKQISPKFIGVKEEDVDYLRQKYLKDIRLSETFGITRSFFDQSAIRFGDTIRLVEHFRCMPEIIQFSNNLCYSNEPLIPVRQFGADRLEPIKTVHVENGYPKKSGSKTINIPEAEALVQQIVECSEDPRYEKKTMGVISLLGEAQAKIIETMLLEKIGAEQIEERKLICGDAYEFQGDERNIIFISMVSAPSEENRIGVLSKEEDKKRFNVAVSRAQDQLWLFHSATLNDLSNKCLRYELLSYCTNPKLEPIEYNNKEVLPDVRHEDFDSLFEQRVYLKMLEKGYRVVPQYKIAGYRIDLMVFGMEGRLAVECDGDEFHTAENYADDLARQRDLERYGLHFWRIRGSEFYRDPDKSLEPLWETLAKRGISPETCSVVNEREEYEDYDNEISEEEEDFVEQDFPSKVYRQEEQNQIDYGVQKISGNNEKSSINCRDISIDELMPVIVIVLEGCPNNSCTRDSLTQRVCKQLKIITRGKPREDLEKRIYKALKSLIAQKIVEEYQATNIRVRLVDSKNKNEIISENVKKIMEVPFDTWFEILNWNRDADILESYQRGITYSLGKLAKNKLAPSEKQARQGLIILEEAKKNGFLYQTS